MDDTNVLTPTETTVDTGTDTSTSTDTGLDFDIGTGTDTTESQVPKTDQTQPETPPQTAEEPETTDFRGHVSNRIRNLVKQAPELGQVLTKYPKIRDAIEAPLRREAAYRDVFPTVAEAKAMRETFPNGIQDVQALKDDLRETEEIDSLTYTRDADGNYAGHGKLIDNIYSSDRDAAMALFKTLPKEWARLDRNSYNDVMGKIVGATLTANGEGGAWAQLIELREQAASTDALKALVPTLDKVLNRLAPFVEDRKPDAATEALNRDRQQFDRQRQESQNQDNQQFSRTFAVESKKLQLDVIGQHKVMQKLATVKSVTPGKRAEIAEKVRVKVEKFLSNSPSFMRKITPAFNSRNMDEAANIQRAAWSQEWLLNRMIRDVLKVETPQLVNQNRAAVERRTSTAPATKPAPQSSNGKPTAPFQENGVWYHANGSKMTTVEAMRHAMAQS